MDNETTERRVTADPAEAESEIAAAELGKFKSVAALLDAYKNLEAEFTRRSQRLKEFEEGNKAKTQDGQAQPENGGTSSREVLTEGELLDAALNSEKVKKAVVEEYLKTVSERKSVPLIFGGEKVAAPDSKPKSVREAGALAARFLKK